MLNKNKLWEMCIFLEIASVTKKCLLAELTEQFIRSYLISLYVLEDLK